MKIKWLAHAAFLITTESGTRIITDPYKASPHFRHGVIKETADIVTTSHDHSDHNYTATLKGDPQVVGASGTFKDVEIRAVLTAHDDCGGTKNGLNTVFVIAAEGLNVCHCGDLGHVLTEAQVRAVGKVDVIMIPVGGFFTIDAATATKVCEQLKPSIILPMHYKTEEINLTISGVEDFLNGKDDVKRFAGSEIEVKAGSLPDSPRIIVLEHSL